MLRRGGNEPPTPDAPADAISPEAKSAGPGAGGEGAPETREGPSGTPLYEATQLPTDRIIIKFKNVSAFLFHGYSHSRAEDGKFERAGWGADAVC